MPMHTNISYPGDLASKTPKKNSNQSTLEILLKKVSESSTPKDLSPIANSTLTAPIINVSSIPIDVFVANTDNQDSKQYNIILDLEHAEFEKVYAPVAYFHNESDGYEISEKGRTRHISIYGCNFLCPKINNTLYVRHFLC